MLWETKMKICPICCYSEIPNSHSICPQCGYKHNAYQASHCSIEHITPENIAIIISFVTAAIGITSTVIKAIKLWVGDRKSWKIRIKYHDLEIELSGAMSEKDIENRFSLFERLREKIKEDEVKIIISE